MDGAGGELAPATGFTGDQKGPITGGESLELGKPATEYGMSRNRVLEGRFRAGRLWGRPLWLLLLMRCHGDSCSFPSWYAVAPSAQRGEIRYVTARPGRP